MGCDTCKQKKEKVVNNNEKNVNFFPQEVAENGLNNGSLVFKLIAFLVIIVAIPLIVVVLIGQIFFHFFFPKSLPKISKKFRDFFVNLLTKYGEFKYRKELKKRKKQFEGNKGYEEGSELVEVVDYEENSEFGDIEVHENNNDVKK